AALQLLSEAALVRTGGELTAAAAKEWLECLYATLEFAEQSTGRPGTLLLRCPEALLEGEPLRLGDSVTAVRVWGVHTPQGANPSRVQVLELDELSKADARVLFEPLLCADSTVAEASYLAVGGHPRLLRLIFDDLHKATAELLQQLSRPNPKPSEAPAAAARDFDDDKPFSGDNKPFSKNTKPSSGAPQGPPLDFSILKRNAFFQGELLRAAATPFRPNPLMGGPQGTLGAPLGGPPGAPWGPPLGGPPGGPHEQGGPPADVINKFSEVHRMQQQRLRVMSETLLVEEFRRFELMVLQFLNFPLLRKLREVSKNEVHFLVVVCETIREFLRRPYLLCGDLAKINNTIILGLLDANLIRARFNPQRLEASGAFTKNLLQSFCNQKYDALSTKEKAEYSLNFLLNQKSIKEALDSL
ncbi:hypothetical protein, conserved, partial [Eimeria tenella]